MKLSNFSINYESEIDTVGTTQEYFKLLPLF